MNKQKKDKIEKQKKYFAYLIAFLFIGSTFAAAVLYGGSRIEAPTNPLLGKPLQDVEIQWVTQNRGAYIVADAPEESKAVLADLVNRYNVDVFNAYGVPLVFLYGETTSNETYIQVTTAKGTKTFSEFDVSAIEDYICEDAHPALIECQTRRALRDFE